MVTVDKDVQNSPIYTALTARENIAIRPSRNLHLRQLTETAVSKALSLISGMQPTLGSGEANG